MSDSREEGPRDPKLNPSLTRRTDTTHDTTVSSPAPADSASVQREEGRAWPVIWLVVVVICAALGLWILFL